MTRAEVDAALPYDWVPVPDDYAGSPGDVNPRYAGWSWADLERLARAVARYYGGRPPRTPAEAWLARLVRAEARRSVRRALRRLRAELDELAGALARLEAGR